VIFKSKLKNPQPDPISIDRRGVESFAYGSPGDLYSDYPRQVNPGSFAEGLAVIPSPSSQD